jgi:hypothetical protein
MQKKRASLLEALPAQLNQQIYIDICRQLQFELGEIYADIAELRMAEANTPAELQKTMKKVNENLATALNHFKHFCKLIEKNGAVPQSADADLVHAYLTARMHIGRLHGKFLLPDSPALVECMAASLKESVFCVYLFHCQSFFNRFLLIVCVTDIKRSKRLLPHIRTHCRCSSKNWQSLLKWLICCR